MNIKENIKHDLNVFLKEKQVLEVLVLRQLLAAILNKEKEERFKSEKKEDVQLDNEKIIDVISSEAKKRRESIEIFEKGGRADLVENEKKELEVLKKYLPEQLSEDDLKNIIKDAIEKTGAENIKDIGKVMQALMPKIKGRADNSLVSRIIKESLSS